MGQRFWGWKTKTGSVTLVMACLALGGWVRSGVVRERFTFASGPHTQQSLFSENGCLLWMTHHDRSKETITHGGDQLLSLAWESLHWIQFGISGFSDIDREMGAETRWRRFGFGSGGLKHDAGNVEDEIVVTFWFIPYWSIVIPLMLISSWLLLSKPRNSNPRKFTEPIVEKVV